MKEKRYDYTGYNNNLRGVARALRCNQTPQENHLWYDFLKSYPIRFRRQRPIGSYIADFYCADAKLIIELDGKQHYTEAGIEHDENRSYVINSYGFEVIRFSNYDINKNFEGVCIEIDKKVKERINALNNDK